MPEQGRVRALAAVARCLNPECPWTTEHGGPVVDLAAERHTTTTGHPTIVHVKPIGA